ncbi:MAG: hypothetical protein [Siphoviridae sp. ctCJE6]|nr:MAG: hypothetical protein [Siphoviridae sp. ctCJE6]
MADAESLGKLIVSIAADLSDLQKGLSDAQNKIKDFSDETEKQTEKSEKSFLDFVQDTAEQLKEFGKELQFLGRQVTQVGGQLARWGALVTAPFVLALKNSKDSVTPVHEELEKLRTILQIFQEEVATAIVPAVSRLSAVLHNLLITFQGISEPVRNTVLQAVFFNAILLVILGTFTLVVGQIIKLASNIAVLTGSFLSFVALNPGIVAIGIAITGLIFLMFKFREIADTVLSTFQTLFIFLKNGFLTIKISFETFLLAVVSGVQKFVDLLARIPGPTQAAFQSIKSAVEDFKESIRGTIEDDIKGISDNVAELTEIIQSGSGSWSEAFENLKQGLADIGSAFDEFDARANQSVENFMAGVARQLEAITNQRNHITETAQRIADLATNIENAFSSALAGLIKGELNAKEFAEQLGNALVDAIVNFVAQQIVAQTIGKALAAAALFFTKGIATATASAWAPAAALASLATLGSNAAPANAALVGTVAAAKTLALTTSALAEGTDKVPARLSPGEMVIPRKFSDAIREGRLSLSGPDQRPGAAFPQGAIIENIEINVEGGIDEDRIPDIVEKIGIEIDNRLRGVT